MNRVNIRKLQNTIMFNTILRFIAGTVLYTTLLFVGYYFAAFIASQLSWRTSTLYYILVKLYNNIFYIIAFVWISGEAAMFFHYWRKTIRYVVSMVEASNSLVKNDVELIHLPVELKMVEEQMNQIKYDVLRNERAAKEAEQRKNDLVVYLAHDLKTPLTSVIGYLTLLRDEQAISEELRAKYLSISLNKAERLEDLINEFFEITRFNLSNLTLELSRVNLTRMLEQITYEFMPLLTEKNLTYQLDISQDIMMKCDVKKLERVFDNLMRNAISYSFENGMIRITVTQKENGVYFKFENQGNTIPEEKLSHMFEQFYRLDTARTSQTGGAGLGLAIAKEIVELHKGSISVSSADEKITFDLYLPSLS